MGVHDKILSVESIRGVACFVVLISHLSLTFFPYLHAFDGEADPALYPIQALLHELPLGFLFSGTSAVFVFFVLSGYILTKVALKNGGGVKRVVLMGVKRYPRLMIPALTSCLIAYFCFYFFSLDKAHLSNWINQYGNEDSYSLVGAIRSGLLDVFFLSGWSVYNPVLWTMKVELFGSFIVYALCLNRITLKAPLLLPVCFLITLAATYAGYLWIEYGLGLIAFYGGYLMGIYGKVISRKLAWILLLIGIYFSGVHNTSWSYLFLYELLSEKAYQICNFLSGFFIVYAIIFNEEFNNWFSNKIAVFMGKVSFSVYLIHMPVISTVGVLLFNGIYSITGLYVIAALLASLLSIAIIYLLAIVFYQQVDYRGMKISSAVADFLFRQSKKPSSSI